MYEYSYRFINIQTSEYSIKDAVLGESTGGTLDPQVREDIYRMHAQICKALADPKRLLILNALRDSEKTVGDLATSLDLPQATVSQHLAILRQRSLVYSRRDGVHVFYTIANQKVIAAFDLLREVMSEQLAKEEELHRAYKEAATGTK